MSVVRFFIWWLLPRWRALHGTTNALIGIVLTIIAYGIINGVISRYSMKTGLTVALFSKVLFDHFGAVVATLIFFAPALYYAVFEGYVMALVLAEWSGNMSMAVATAIVVISGVALIFGSVQHWLDKFNGVLLVAGCMIGVIAYVLMMADVFSYILQALAYQGVFVVAWVGVAFSLQPFLFNAEQMADLLDRTAALPDRPKGPDWR